MVICHIITAFGFGGAEKLLTDLVNIQSRDHEVHIIYLKGEPLLQSMLRGPVQLHKVSLGTGCAAELRKMIRSLKPEVVHTHLGHADLIGLWAVRGLPVKRFCTMHNIWFKWNWKDKVIFFIYKLFFKTIARDCKVIAISRSVADHVEKVLGVTPQNVIMLHNAVPDIRVDKNKEELRKELKIPPNAFCVLFVGRLEKQKSVDTLLLAASILKGKIDNFQVLILGSGTLGSTLENLSLQLELDGTVRFMGNTPTPEKYFSACDIFVLPSIFEGFGIVIIEAFRASLPVLATNIEGPRELIQDGVNGLLCEPRDHETMADKILELYKSPNRRKQIGLNGYKSYESKFDIISYAKNIESIYRK